MYYPTTRGVLDLAKILDLNIYLSPDIPVKSLVLSALASSTSSRHGHTPMHSSDISTLLIPLPRLDSIKGRFDQLVRRLLWEGSLQSFTLEANETAGPNTAAPGRITPSIEILRSKAFLQTLDGKSWILQGVRDLYEVTEIPSLVGEELQPKLVLIGRGLSEQLKVDFITALENVI